MQGKAPKTVEELLQSMRQLFWSTIRHLLRKLWWQLTPMHSYILTYHRIPVGESLVAVLPHTTILVTPTRRLDKGILMLLGEDNRTTPMPCQKKTIGRNRWKKIGRLRRKKKKQDRKDVEAKHHYQWERRRRIKRRKRHPWTSSGSHYKPTYKLDPHLQNHLLNGRPRQLETLLHRIRRNAAFTRAFQYNIGLNCHQPELRHLQRRGGLLCECVQYRTERLQLINGLQNVSHQPFSLKK